MNLQLALALLLLPLAQGYVLIKKEDRAVSKLSAVNQNANDGQQRLDEQVQKQKEQQQEEKEDEEGIQQGVMIRMFEPKEDLRPKSTRVFDDDISSSSSALVDVDILPPPTEKPEENDSAESLAEIPVPESELSQLAMEEPEVRRKQQKKPTMPPRPAIGSRKSWAIKQKTVKLPPLQSFPVPTVARAAPTLSSENSISSSGGGEAGKERLMAAGRQFWVNALKQLLLEFRRMHPEIAGARSRGRQSSQQQQQQLRENRVEHRRMAPPNWE